MGTQVPLGVRVQPSIKEALETAAKDDHRSLASLTERILHAWLKEHGYMAKAK